MRKPEDINITVIGDIMLDHYIIGNVERISPEAPVPVLNVIENKYTLGGAGNVVKNLLSVGCNVNCISIIGNDTNGGMISSLLNGKINKQLIVDNNRKTTIKTRAVTKDGIQLLRIDVEDVNEWNINDSQIEISKETDLIIVSDYGKGMINQKLMDLIKTTGKNILVDPKPKNKELYNGVHMITPNLKEFQEMGDFENFNLDVDHILLTLGKNGIHLINPKEKTSAKFKAKEVNVFNVSGAGDTVISIMGLCIAMGLKYNLAAQIANFSANIVVTKPGTASITRGEFDEIVKEVVNALPKVSSAL